MREKLNSVVGVSYIGTKEERKASFGKQFVSYGQRIILFSRSLALWAIHPFAAIFHIEK